MKTKVWTLALVFVLALVTACGSNTPPLQRDHQAGEIPGAAWNQSSARFRPGTTAAAAYQIIDDKKVGVPGECAEPTGTIVVAMDKYDSAKNDADNLLLVETASYGSQASKSCLVVQRNLRPATVEQLAKIVVPDLMVDVKYAIPGVIDNIPTPLKIVAIPVAGLALYTTWAFGWSNSERVAAKASEMAMFNTVGATEKAAATTESMVKTAFAAGHWDDASNQLARAANLTEDSAKTLKAAKTAEEALALARDLGVPEKLAEAARASRVEMIIGEKTFALALPYIEPGGEVAFHFSRAGYKYATGIWPFRAVHEVPALNVSYMVRRPNPAIEATLKDIRTQLKLLPEMNAKLDAGLELGRRNYVVAQQSLAQGRANARLIESTAANTQAAIAEAQELLQRMGASQQETTRVMEEILGRVDGLASADDVDEIARVVNDSLRRSPTVNNYVTNKRYVTNNTHNSTNTLYADAVDDFTDEIGDYVAEHSLPRQVQNIARPSLTVSTSSGAQSAGNLGLTATSSMPSPIPASVLMKGVP